VTPPLIYVAGPYRASTEYGLHDNIARARQAGALLAASGAYPVIPHCNTAFMGGLQSDAFWLKSTLELLRRCDGAVFVGAWRRSVGSVGEWQEAERLAMPRLELEYTHACTAELQTWLRGVCMRRVCADS